MNGKKITSDQIILEAVKGYKIEFDPNLPRPTRARAARQYKRNASESTKIQAALKIS